MSTFTGLYTFTKGKLSVEHFNQTMADFSRNWSVLFLLVIGLCGNYYALGQTCNANNCKMPSCFCAGGDTPGGLTSQLTPQIVLFMFDGSVSNLNYPFYDELFTDTRMNPNGCPIGGTVFVSNNYTDYSAVRKLYLKGLEIGVRSVTSKIPQDWWKTASIEDMKYEILEQRKNLNEKAQIPLEELRGWRSPYLQSSGSSLYRTLQLNDFEYDSTVVTTSWSGNSSISWPFTLDYPYPERCLIAPCPSESYPGLWEVPVVPVRDILDKLPCSYLDGCGNQPENKADVLTYLRKNFQPNYNGNRAPVYFNLHTVWLQTDSFKRDGLNEFITELTNLDDVYVVTAHQLLEWVKDPQTTSKVKDFAPWSCPNHVNSETGIWDQLMNIFKDGTGSVKVMKPKEVVTIAPRRNFVYYRVDSESSANSNDFVKICTFLMSSVTILLTAFLS